MQVSDQSSLSGEPNERVPAALSDTGCERELNEDRYAVIESGNVLTWVVCDGMGGVSGGELAAQIAIDTMRRNLEQSLRRSATESLASAVLDANRVIVLRRQNPQFSSMGTTIVAVSFSGPQVVLAFAGDSRAYVVRDSSIELLTRDHTYVQELVDRGEMKQEDAMAHPQAHVLTRCLGADPALNLEHRVAYLHASESPETMVLCTDGLYSLVTDEEIFAIVKANSSQKACVELVELARSRGGYDNITVAIVPLEGALSDVVPENFTEAAAVEEAYPTPVQPLHSPAQLVQYGVLVGMLSCLAVLVTVMITAVVASR